MDIFDYFLWAFAVFTALYGISLLAMPKKMLLPEIRKQFAAKGNAEPSNEEIDAKFKQLRRYGVVCIVLSVGLLGFLLRGGIFGL